MNINKKPAIGLSDFRQLITGNYYYIDKTLLIKEVLDSPAPAMLLPRPRRFGKTLNLSMLRYFFEKSERSNAALFDGLHIQGAGDAYMAECGQYPVIYLTLKDVKTQNWDTCLEHLRSLIADEYRRHCYILDDNMLDDLERAQYEAILSRSGKLVDYESSLKYLLAWLERYHQKQVVLLVDEYDTPIHAGYVRGYYEQIITFMRVWLGGGLKDHPSLKKGLLTGILRVAKESIFSGLNNLEVHNLLNIGPFADKFGFTDAEVVTLLDDFDLSDHLDEVRDWYNGYCFGDAVIYNPWSVLCYVNQLPNPIKPHWVNSSDNRLVYDLIQQGGPGIQRGLERLLNGETIDCEVNDAVALRDIQGDEDAVWSLLLFSGYLKPVGHKYRRRRLSYELAIPNQEIETLYADTAGSRLVSQ